MWGVFGKSNNNVYKSQNPNLDIIIYNCHFCHVIVTP